MSIWKDDKLIANMKTARGYYPSQEPNAGSVGRYFGGESVTEVGLKAGVTKDYWVAVAPDGAFLGEVVDKLDKELEGSTPRRRGPPSAHWPS